MPPKKKSAKTTVAAAVAAEAVVAEAVVAEAVAAEAVVAEAVVAEVVAETVVAEAVVAAAAAQRVVTRARRLYEIAQGNDNEVENLGTTLENIGKPWKPWNKSLKNH